MDLTDNSSDISPADRDVAIRTMIGEENTPTGMAGVASTMLNRAASGQYGGKSLSGVAFAPNQYQAWQANPARLLSIKPTDPKYQQAAQIFDGVASGTIPDLTNGSTHYYAPAAQAAAGRAPPAWAKGNGVPLGNSLFYAPEGPAHYNAPALQAINSATSGKQPSQSDPIDQFLPIASKGPAVDPVDQFLQPQPAASAGASAATPANDPVSLFLSPARVVGAGPEDLSIASQIPGMPQLTNADIAKMKAAPTAVENIGAQSQTPLQAAQQLGGYIVGQAAGIPAQVASDFQAGTNLAGSGIEDVKQGKILPSFPSWNPSTWNAGGALKTLAGAAAAAYSPVAGTVDQLVQQPVTNATGNPDIGQKAALVTNLLAGPLAGEGVGAAAGAILPAARAANTVKSVLGEVPSPTVINRLSANPRLSLMDVDPHLQQQALGLATDPAYPAFGIMRNAVNQRIAEAPQAVSGAYDTAAGATPNVKTLLDSIKATAAANGKRNFGAALTNAAPVNIQPVLDAIDSKLYPGVMKSVSTPSGLPPGPVQSALLSLRNQLTNGTSVLTDADTLHTIQSNLGVEARTLAGSASGQDRLIGGALGSVRAPLVDAIDAATGGKFKPAQAQYADDMSIQDAFDKGNGIYKNNSLEDRPEFWQAWRDNASPEELAAARLGMRVAADQAINGTRFGSRNGANIADVPFNVDKMKILLGNDEATQLAQTLNDEKTIAGTNNLLAAGSKTAVTQKAQDMIAVRQPGVANLLGGTLGSGVVPAFVAEHLGAGNYGAAAAGVLGAGANYLGRLSDIGRNTQAARLLTMPGNDAISKLYGATRPTALPRNLLLGAISGSLGSGNKFIDASAPPNP